MEKQTKNTELEIEEHYSGEGVLHRTGEVDQEYGVGDRDLRSK